jgi:hypothetical protein
MGDKHWIQKPEANRAVKNHKSQIAKVKLILSDKKNQVSRRVAEITENALFRGLLPKDHSNGDPKLKTLNPEPKTLNP